MRKVSPGEVFVYTIGKNVVSKQGRTDIPVDVTTIHLDFFSFVMLCFTVTKSSLIYGGPFSSGKKVVEP